MMMSKEVDPADINNKLGPSFKAKSIRKIRSAGSKKKVFDLHIGVLKRRCNRVCIYQKNAGECDLLFPKTTALNLHVFSTRTAESKLKNSIVYRIALWDFFPVFSFLSVTLQTGSCLTDFVRNRTVMERIMNKVTKLPKSNKENLEQDDLENDGLQGIHLRDYQLAGVGWMKHCFDNKHGCILGDEMGLGKTVQVCHLDANQQP